MLMKRLLLAALVASVPLTTNAAETAYTALRQVGKKGGESSLSRVVEMRGRFGAPEPAMWKITLQDPEARGGVREYEVQQGRITGERAPSGRAATGTPLDLGKLNIDS